MAKLIVISWRDIPSQVVVKSGRDAEKIQLSHRFQEAIDRAAMRAGKSGSDAYLADWARSVPRAIDGDPKAAAQACAQELESRYSDEDLLRLIRAHGLEPGSLPPSERAAQPEAGQA
jgi:Virulence factor